MQSQKIQRMYICQNNRYLHETKTFKLWRVESYWTGWEQNESHTTRTSIHDFLSFRYPTNYKDQFSNFRNESSFLHNMRPTKTALKILYPLTSLSLPINVLNLSFPEHFSIPYLTTKGASNF